MNIPGDKAQGDSSNKIYGGRYLEPGGGGLLDSTTRGPFKCELWEWAL